MRLLGRHFDALWPQAGDEEAAWGRTTAISHLSMWLRYSYTQKSDIRSISALGASRTLKVILCFCLGNVVYWEMCWWRNSRLRRETFRTGVHYGGVFKLQVDSNKFQHVFLILASFLFSCLEGFCNVWRMLTEEYAIVEKQLLKYLSFWHQNLPQRYPKDL